MEEVIKGKIQQSHRERKQDTFLRDATEPLAARYIGSSKSFTGTGVPWVVAQVSMK